MAVDSHGNVDVVWLDDSAGTPAVFFSRSSDGGQTFSAPLNISNHQGSPAESERIAVDSAENIYVVWSEDSSGAHTIFFSRSRDNGMSFSSPQLISQNSMGTDPAIAADSAGGINLLWIDKSQAQRTIFFTRSTDQGRTFSMPMALSTAEAGSGAPQIITDPSGNRYVVWMQTGTGSTESVFFTHDAETSSASFSLDPPIAIGSRSSGGRQTSGRPTGSDGPALASRSGPFPEDVISPEEFTNETVDSGKRHVGPSILRSISVPRRVPGYATLVNVEAPQRPVTNLSPVSSCGVSQENIRETREHTDICHPYAGIPGQGSDSTPPYTLNDIRYVDGVHYATVQAAMDAVNSVGGGVVIVPCGSYAGPTTFYTSVAVESSCPYTYGMPGSYGQPISAQQGTFLNYSTELSISGISNSMLKGVILDFQNSGFGLTLGNSFSSNDWEDVQVRRCGDELHDCMLWSVTLPGAANNDVGNTFRDIFINPNQSSYANCMTLQGVGPVNSGGFVTDNFFDTVICSGAINQGLTFRINTDTNKFQHVLINNLGPLVPGAAALVFNDINPASDQDADGEDIQDFIFQGSFTSSIKAGQSSGNRISATQGSAGALSLNTLGGTPLYTVQTIGLPGVNADDIIGGTLTASAISGGGAGTGAVAGDITAERSTTVGAIFLGGDGSQLYRNGNTASLTYGTNTVQYPNASGIAVLDSATQTLFNKTLISPVITGAPTGNNIPIIASLTTTAATSEKVTMSGMTASGHCSLTATNYSAAANIATTYVSVKATNEITVTHAAVSGMSFDLFCTAN